MSGKKLLLMVLLFLAVSFPPRSRAGGVTVITHGYDGDVTGWITTMAEQIPLYYQQRYPELGTNGTNFTIYTVTLTTDGNGNYYYQWTRDGGGSPFNTDTGEIIVMLDWSQMAGDPDPFSSVYDISTYTVASVASYVLLETNSISDLNGHALVEYPLHLVGHSRGGSLMAQLSLILGTNGIWVDHLTTIDPHPLNNDGNDDSPISVVDAPAQFTYANVLFADNYWEDLGNAIPTDLDPHGEPVSGAYQRQLTQLNGGYPPEEFDFEDSYEYHSNSHLWYYGTMNSNTPVTYDDDGENVTLNSSMRSSWWVSYDRQGDIAGFYYSLIGGGNRLSTNSPVGAGYPEIVDGFNQWWDLGAGTYTNRTALPENSGTWPNLIELSVLGTNVVTSGGQFSAQFYYQYGGAATNLSVQFFLGGDFNPYDGNSVSVGQFAPGNTGTNYVGAGAVDLSTTGVTAGTYSLYGKISDGTHTRFLYAPQLVRVLAQPPPVLSITGVGIHQTISIAGGLGWVNVLQSSPDLKNWQTIYTLTNTSGLWFYPLTNVPAKPQQFYRVIVNP